MKDKDHEYEVFLYKRNTDYGLEFLIENNTKNMMFEIFMKFELNNLKISD